VTGGPPTLFVARKSFWVGNTLVRAGDTVAAGHPILRGRDRLFAPLTPTFGFTRPAAAGAERAVAVPGETRPTDPVGGLIFDHTRRELEAKAEAAGIDTSTLTTKTKLAEALVASEGGG
jgi:hypothetical protein